MKNCPKMICAVFISAVLLIIAASCGVDYKEPSEKVTVEVTVTVTVEVPVPVTVTVWALAPSSSGTVAAPSTDSAEAGEFNSGASSGNITADSLPETVNTGEKATVSITGEPDTEYILTVYYASGNKSTAGGLGAAVSDTEGHVSWTWRIGNNTKPGTGRLVITGAGETYETAFEVLD